MTDRFSVALDVSALCVKFPTGIAFYAKGFIDELLRRPDQIDLEFCFKGKLFREYDQFFQGLPTRPKRYVLKTFPTRTGRPITHSLDKRFLYNRGAINIATIHDVSYFVPGNYVTNWVANRFKGKMRRSNSKIARLADQVVCVSEHSKADYCRLYGFDEERVKVIYPGFQPLTRSVSADDDLSALAKYGQTLRSYFLFAGRVDRGKNVLSMIDAFKDSGLASDFDFIIAGPHEPDTPLIRERVAELGLDDSIQFPGYVPTSEMAALYRNARGFVYPTYYEGFGMPILESMSCGVPVLIGDRGAAPEIAAGHAIVADPFSVDSIKNGMIKLAEGGHDPEALKAHGQSFTWTRFVDEVFELYRELLGTERPG